MPAAVRLALLAVLAAAVALAPAASTEKSDLVATQVGNLPVILSAPHGGTAGIPGVPRRTGEHLKDAPARSFVTGRDWGTEELTHALADAVKAETGRKPYFVVAKFAREFADANRPPEIAYEHKSAKPVYDAYHAALTNYCKEVKRVYGRGLLIDVHGQKLSKETLYRGTQNGTTVKLLRDRFGEKAHTGRDSLFGLLAGEGFKVHPPDLSGVEQPEYAGGYIVRTYGSHTGYGIDAIQLEFGGDYRGKEQVTATADKVAVAVRKYVKLYLTDSD